jgi:hypothetical protein
MSKEKPYLMEGLGKLRQELEKRSLIAISVLFTTLTSAERNYAG